MRQVASGRSMEVSPTLWGRSSVRKKITVKGKEVGYLTFDRKIVFTSGLCWNHCKIRIRSV